VKQPLCLKTKKNQKSTLSLSLNKHEGPLFTKSADPEWVWNIHANLYPPIYENLKLKIEQLKKWAKFDHVRIFQELKKKTNYFGWNVSWMLKNSPIVILWWRYSFTSIPSEWRQLVTFTDGSDMYIHFKVLYIAVMLGIVQKEE
jgi:hypothetical protein